MTIKTFTFNPFQENTYLIYNETNEAVLIDAGCISDSEKQILKKFIDDNELILKRLINTHLHFDHQFGNKFVFDNYGILPEAAKEDEFLLENVVAQARSFGFKVEQEAQKLGAYITENQEIKFGNTTLKAIHVPGHSPGSMAFYAEKNNVLFAGDVLFQGSIGRTDLPQGDYATLITSITKKLLPTPPPLPLYIADMAQQQPLKARKKNNPYL